MRIAMLLLIAAFLISFVMVPIVVAVESGSGSAGGVSDGTDGGSAGSGMEYDANNPASWSADDWKDPSRADYAKVQDWNAVDIARNVPPQRFYEVPLGKLSAEKVQSVTAQQWSGRDPSGKPNYDRGSALRLNALPSAMEAVRVDAGLDSFAVDPSVVGDVFVRDGVLVLGSANQELVLPKSLDEGKVGGAGIVGIDVVRDAFSGEERFKITHRRDDISGTLAVATAQTLSSMRMEQSQDGTLRITATDLQGKSRDVVVEHASDGTILDLRGVQSQVFFNEGRDMKVTDFADSGSQTIVIDGDLVRLERGDHKLSITLDGAGANAAVLFAQDGSLHFARSARDGSSGSEAVISDVSQNPLFDAVVLHDGSSRVALMRAGHGPVSSVTAQNGGVRGLVLAPGRAVDVDWSGSQPFTLGIVDAYAKVSSRDGEVMPVSTGAFSEYIRSRTERTEDNGGVFGQNIRDRTVTKTYGTFAVVARDEDQLYVSSVDKSASALVRMSRPDGRDVGAIVRNGEVHIAQLFGRTTQRSITSFKDPVFGSDVQVSFKDRSSVPETMMYHASYDSRRGVTYEVDERVFNQLGTKPFFAPPELKADASLSGSLHVRFNAEAFDNGYLRIEKRSVGFDEKAGDPFVLEGRTVGNIVSQSIFSKEIEFELKSATMEVMGRKFSDVTAQKFVYGSTDNSVLISGIQGGLHLKEGHELIRDGVITITPQGVLTAKAVYDIETKINEEPLAFSSAFVAEGIGRQYYAPAMLASSFVDPSSVKLSLEDASLKVAGQEVARMRGDIYIAPRAHDADDIIFDLSGSSRFSTGAGSLAQADFRIVPGMKTGHVDPNSILEGSFSFMDAQGNRVTAQSVRADFTLGTQGGDMLFGVRELAARASLDASLPPSSALYELVGLRIGTDGRPVEVASSGNILLRDMSIRMTPSDVRASIGDAGFVGSLLANGNDLAEVRARVQAQEFLSRSSGQDRSELSYSAGAGALSLSSADAKTVLSWGAPSGREISVDARLDASSGERQVEFAKLVIPEVLVQGNPSPGADLTGSFKTLPEGIYYDKGNVFGGVSLSGMYREGSLESEMRRIQIDDLSARINAVSGERPHVFLTGDRAFFAFRESDALASGSVQGEQRYRSFAVKDFGSDIVLDADYRSVSLLNGRMGTFDMVLEKSSADGAFSKAVLKSTDLRASAWVQKEGGHWELAVPSAGVAVYDFQVRQSDPAQKLALKTVDIKGTQAQVSGVRVERDASGNSVIRVDEAGLKDFSQLLYVKGIPLPDAEDPNYLRLAPELRVPLDVHDLRLPQGMVIDRKAGVDGRKEVVITVPQVLADSGDFRLSVKEIFNGKVEGLEMQNLQMIPQENGVLMRWDSAQAVGAGETDFASGKRVTATFSPRDAINPGGYILLEEPFGLEVKGLNFRVDAARPTGSGVDLSFVAQGVEGYTRLLEDRSNVKALVGGDFVWGTPGSGEDPLNLGLGPARVEFSSGSGRAFLSLPAGLRTSVLRVPDKNSGVLQDMDLVFTGARDIPLHRMKEVNALLNAQKPDPQKVADAIRLAGGTMDFALVIRESGSQKHLRTVLLSSNDHEVALKGYLVPLSERERLSQLSSLHDQSRFLEALQLNYLVKSRLPRE